MMKNTMANNTNNVNMQIVLALSNLYLSVVLKSDESSTIRSDDQVTLDNQMFVPDVKRAQPANYQGTKLVGPLQVLFANIRDPIMGFSLFH